MFLENSRAVDLMASSMSCPMTIKRWLPHWLVTPRALAGSATTYTLYTTVTLSRRDVNFVVPLSKEIDLPPLIVKKTERKAAFD